jgi:hypothetical protein
MTPRNYKISLKKKKLENFRSLSCSLMRMNLWKNIMLRPQADDNQNDLKEK